MHLNFRKSILLVFSVLFYAYNSFAQGPDCVNNPTYGDPPAANFFNTGTDGNGGTLPGGAQDLNWQVSMNGINGPYSPAIVMYPIPGNYYVSPWPDCAWISHSQSGLHYTDTDIYYKFSFTLDCFNSCHQSFSQPNVFCLGLDFFADNAVYEIIVNGVVQNIPGIPVANPYYYQGYIQANMVSVQLCSNWQPGNNDLIIHVVSGPNYEGFLAQASTNTPPPVIDTTYDSFCSGTQYIFGPDVISSPGTYNHTFMSQSGCDSNVTLILSMLPSYDQTVNQSICYYDSFLFAGTYYKTSGLYTHLFKTTQGCDSNVHLQLTVNQVTANVSSTNVLCNGDASGSISVNPFNNPAGYTYALGAGPYAATNVFNGLTAGTYTVHTKSNAGCIKDNVVTITEPTKLVISNLTKVAPLCNTSFGSVTVSASGGKPGYTYALDAGPYTINNSFNSLLIGTYTVHVKDANGCIVDSVVNMTGPTALGTNVSVTNEPCHGQSLGAINAAGTGGTAPYTYAINAGPYTASGSFGSLAAGAYTIHVHDSHNCSYDTLVTVTQPTSLGGSVSITGISCHGDNNGSITIIPNGGTQPFTYSLNGSPFNGINIFNNLSASIDSLSVKDANGCTIDTVVVIPQIAKLEVTDMLLRQVKCAGGSDGGVQVFANGGTLPYTYAIDGGLYQVSTVLNNLYAGQHTLHIKDAHNCITDTLIDIAQPSQLGFSNITVSPAKCEGEKNGTVLLVGSGGTPSYTYSSDNLSFTTNNYYTGLGLGNYRYYIKDSNGCKADSLVAVVDNPHINIEDPAITTPSCFGMGDATLTINADGGIAPLAYQLDGNPTAPQSSNMFSNLQAGTHTVTVIDSNGCTKSKPVTIRQTAKLSLEMFSNGNLCEGVDNNGAVHVRATGGTPPYRYFWSTDSLNASYQNGITGLGNGSYNVRVVDEHECMAWGKASVEYDNCCTPYVPTAFTPNDDGKNDIFRVRYKGNITLEKMSIYNRYGQEVYSTTNTTDGWDGTYKGVPQDIGTYYLYITFYCGDGESNKQIVKSDITLVR